MYCYYKEILFLIINAYILSIGILAWYIKITSYTFIEYLNK